MTDEVKPEGSAPEQVEQTSAPQEREYSAVEQRAMDMGWRPREEFGGEDEDFVDAKEFVGRKPLFDKIDQQNKRLKNFELTAAQMREHMLKVEKAAYDRAISDLKMKQKQARAAGDLDTYDELADEIEAQKAEKEEAVKAVVEAPQQSTEIHPTLKAWKQKNPWYDTQPHMQTYADSVAVRMSDRGMAGDELLKAVEKAVREEFPNKFRNPNQNRPSDVEGGRSGGSKSKGNDYQLTEEQEQVCRNFVRSKLMTRDEYIASLKSLDKRES